MDVLPNLDNDLLMWSSLIGALLPPGIAVVNQAHWSAMAKGIVALLICIVVGAGTAYFNGVFGGRGMISCVLVIVILALFTYQTYWKPSGIAPAIEAATTPGPSMR